MRVKVREKGRESRRERGRLAGHRINGNARAVEKWARTRNMNIVLDGIDARYVSAAPRYDTPTTFSLIYARDSTFYLGSSFIQVRKKKCKSYTGNYIVHPSFVPVSNFLSFQNSFNYF